MTASQPNHRAILMPSGRQGDVAHGTTVLEAARQLGVEIESICGGNQTCGKCLISPEFGQFAKHGITSNSDHITPPDATETAYAHKHHLDLNQVRLSCSACILGDLLIHVPDTSLARRQVVRKEASNLQIELSPAVRLVYVRVVPAELGLPGDWERIQQAVQQQHGLTHLTIDPLLLPHLQKTLRQGNWSITLTIHRNRQVIRYEAGYSETLYGLAVDIGSTTIAAHLCNLLTGEVVATESTMNPQVRYGEDLMSRVSYGMMNPNGVDKMHRAVIKALNQLITQAEESAGLAPHSVCDVVLVGNSVMHHILLNVDPVELGGAPFALVTQQALDLKARDLSLTATSSGAMVHILPCIAGHVGADNVAVLLAEQSLLDDKNTLIVDIGTNAEILFGNRDVVLSASSPTGPAFEGAQIEHGQRAAPGAIERIRIDRTTGEVRYKVIGDTRWNNELDEGTTLSPTGICGSGIIEVVAEMFLAGMIDAGGLFNVAASERFPAVRPVGRTAELLLESADKTATGKDIVVTQQDIRNIQLAKAALYAGVKLLMDRHDIRTVDRIKLAGAFGSYIDPYYAMVLGLIPDCQHDQVSAVGNAAGDGARIALLNYEQRLGIQDSVLKVEYVETAVEPGFQAHFVAAMGLPHASDAFPHLADVLPAPTEAEDAEGGRNRRRDRRSRRTNEA